MDLYERKKKMLDDLILFGKREKKEERKRVCLLEAWKGAGGWKRAEIVVSV